MAFKIENGILKRYIEEYGVTEITIPDNVTSIRDYAFSDCKIINIQPAPVGLVLYIMLSYGGYVRLFLLCNCKSSCFGLLDILVVKFFMCASKCGSIKAVRFNGLVPDFENINGHFLGIAVNQFRF